MSLTESEPRLDADYAALFDEMTKLARAVGAGADAEDVAQETLLNARNKITQLRDPQQLRPWLRRSTVRRALASRRATQEKSRRVVVLLPTDPGPGALGPDVRAALFALPTRERLAITLVYALGYSQEEAAQVLGIRRGTIASSLFRARRNLAQALLDYRK